MELIVKFLFNEDWDSYCNDLTPDLIAEDAIMELAGGVGYEIIKLNRNPKFHNSGCHQPSIDNTTLPPRKDSSIERVDEFSKRAVKITIQYLIEVGFVKDNNGNYWIDLKTHYLDLMFSNGYWYPVYAQVPEMSNEEEQRVSINRIEFVHELQNLYFALTGNKLERM